jgi:acetyl esterase
VTLDPEVFVPLDPQIEALLTMMNQAPPLSAGSVASARSGFRLVAHDLRDPATKDPVGSVEDVTYPAAEGDRPARIYRPEGTGPVPTILFAHGGAFIMGDLDTHDDHGRLLCHETGSVVISIDYRLAPEHPFPAGHDDTAAALRHVVATVAELGGDSTRIAVAGDSAGANLVASAAIVARDEGLPLAAQLLIYPPTDFVEEHPSRDEMAEGYFLTKADMEWIGEQVEFAGADRSDSRASLLHQPDLTGVAPAIIGTAEFDPLRDEGEAYAAALEKAGVPVVLRRFDGLIHGFVGMTHVSAAADRAARLLCADLKELLG